MSAEKPVRTASEREALLRKVEAERSQAQRYGDTQSARAEIAEQKLADLRASITEKADEWSEGTDEREEWLELLDGDSTAPSGDYFDLLFTVPPGSDSEFVEAEDPDGRSIKVGEWIAPTEDTFWRLRVSLDAVRAQAKVEERKRLTQAVEVELRAWGGEMFPGVAAFYTRVRSALADQHAPTTGEPS